MQLNTYLTFDGRCEEAFKFYEQALGAKILMMIPNEGSPAAEHVTAEWRNKILHARLQLGESILMGSDSPPERYTEPKGFSVTLSVHSAADAERIFQALAKDGTIRMPIQETFWAVRFGMVTDRFGTPWMVNCEKRT